jgi:putative two-component system response regulator
MTQRPAILVIDDDPAQCRLLAEILEGARYRVAQATCAASARELLAERHFALVVCDLTLPGESGESIVGYIRATYPSTAVLVVSGGSDHATAERLTALGVYGYLVKPFAVDQFLITTANALRRRELELERLLYARALEQAVADRTAQLAGSRRETVKRLAAAVDSRDGMTGLHSERTGHFAATIALRLGMPPGERELLALAAPLHDIGKLAVPDNILHKPDALNPAEWRIMQAHTTAGHDLLAGSGEELLELAAEIALTHHERLDGSGYPYGLAGEAIPESGRIVAVADTFDALTSDRAYRPAFSTREATAMLVAMRGGQLEPDMVDALVASLREDPYLGSESESAHPVGAGSA